MTRDVETHIEAHLGRITLNRPEALHALTLEMCRTITARLLAWRHDPRVEVVVLDHAGPRGFCAGGDIRMLAESGAGDGLAAQAFFHTEYRLNHLLSAFEKPVVTIMDGVTMGGGVGLAMPARYRVATERTTFAMPETGIGLFPDVGGGWFLPRLPFRAGYWLGLTGARLKAADCIHLGVANAFIPSESVGDLVAALRAPSSDIPAILHRLKQPFGYAPLIVHLLEMRSAFSGSTIEEIDEKLLANGSDGALAQRAALEAKSPTALHVALRQLQTGAAATSFAENQRMEFRIASRLVHEPDFREGVRALIVDKDNRPRWAPLPAAEAGAVLDRIFQPLPADQEWTPLEMEHAT